jgi:hypothetical protein
MSEDYFKLVSADEARRAFALDWVMKAIGTQGEKLMEGKDWAAKRIVERAKVFEDYLKGQE